MSESSPKLTQSLLYLGMYFSHPGCHPSCLLFGAFVGLTPFKSDFFDYVKCIISVCNISKFNDVIGIETAIHNSVNAKGHFVYLPQVAYHLIIQGLPVQSSSLSSEL